MLILDIRHPIGKQIRAVKEETVRYYRWLRLFIKTSQYGVIIVVAFIVSVVLIPIFTIATMTHTNTVKFIPTVVQLDPTGEAGWQNVGNIQNIDLSNQTQLQEFNENNSAFTNFISGQEVMPAVQEEQETIRLPAPPGLQDKELPPAPEPQDQKPEEKATPPGQEKKQENEERSSLFDKSYAFMSIPLEITKSYIARSYINSSSLTQLAMVDAGSRTERQASKDILSPMVFNLAKADEENQEQPAQGNDVSQDSEVTREENPADATENEQKNNELPTDLPTGGQEADQNDEQPAPQPTEEEPAQEITGSSPQPEVILPIIDEEEEPAPPEGPQEAPSIFTIRKDIVLSGFQPEVERDAASAVESVRFNLSMGITGGLGEDDELLIGYKVDDNGAWTQLASFTQDKDHSNFRNGDYFSYDLPADTDLSQLRVEIFSLSNNDPGAPDYKPLPIYIDAAWTEVDYKDKVDDLGIVEELTKKKEFVFNIEETPQFEFGYNNEDRGLVDQLIAFVFRNRNFKIIEAKIINFDGAETDISKEITQRENGNWVVKIPKKDDRSIKPGKYTLKIIAEEDAQQYIEDQDFYWGVLAININKSTYLPQEEAYIQMAALTDTGHTICGASLKLEIFPPTNPPSGEINKTENTETTLPQTNEETPVSPSQSGPPAENPASPSASPSHSTPDETDENQSGPPVETPEEMADEPTADTEVENPSTPTNEPPIEKPATTPEEPETETITLSTQDGTIQYSGKCDPNNVTDIPDYFAYYKAEKIGSYQMRLASLDENGNEIHHISSSFEVQESVPFDVERVGATRIYPLAKYKMRFKIKANEDFTGNIIEHVPNSFAITESSEYMVQNGAQETRIFWPVQLKAGDIKELAYEFDAPDVSPELYLLGPLKIGVWQEARFWQIAADAISVKKGTFAALTGTAPYTQQVTGVGFQPKAVIFYYTLQTAEGAAVANYYGMGFATSSTEERAISSWSEVADPTDSGRMGSQTYCILMQTLNGGLAGRAELVSFDSGGFTLNWVTAASAAYIIHYIALGNTDITNAKAGTFDLTTGSGNQGVTGVGFQPEFVMFLSASVGTTYDTNTAHSIVSSGFATDATNEGAVAFAVEDAQTSSDTYSQQRTNASILSLLGTGGQDVIADFVSFGADGFTVNKSDVPAATQGIFYLALKGGQYKVGNFVKLTAVGVQQVNGVGFRPSGLFMESRDLAVGTTVSANAYHSIGAAQGPNTVGTIWSGDADADTSADPDMATLSTKVIRMATGATPVVAGEANLASMDSSGFTLNWTTADATARQVIYWAVGPKVVDTPLSGLIQYASDHATIIPVGGSTTDGVTTNLYLDFDVASANMTDVITPKVEVESINTAFDNVATATGASFKYDPEIPGFRSFPSVIYDSANDRLIAFGGRQNNKLADTAVYKNDVWELKLPTPQEPSPYWRQMSPSGDAPTVRSASACIYDAANQRMVCFGGWIGSALGGFYELTLPSSGDGAWTTLTPTGTVPTNRYTEAIYDSANQRMIIFGGWDGAADLKDLYSVTLPGVGQNGVSTQYTDAPAALEARSEHALIYDASNQRMVLFAGWGVSYNDTWTLTLPSDLAGKVWTERFPTGGPPAARHAHEAIYDSANQRMIVYGGTTDTTYLDDIWELTLPASGDGVWTDKSPNSSERPMSLKTMAGIYDSVNQRMITFGGVQSSTYLSNYLITIDLPSSGNFNFKEIAPLVNLKARDASVSVYDTANQKMVMFGGYGRIYDAALPTDSGNHLSEVWALSSTGAASWKNLSPSIGPIGRELPSAVYDSLNNRLVIFGGVNALGDRTNDVWALSLSSSANPAWTKLEPSSSGSAWDVSGAGYDEKSFSIAGQDQNPCGLYFNDVGTEMYIAGNTNNTIYQYSLSTAWDVSSAAYNNKFFSIGGQDTDPQGLFFNDVGTEMYMAGSLNDKIYQYSLSTAWDVSTAVYNNKFFSVAGQGLNPRGIYFKSDGLKMYTVDNTSGTVYQYSLFPAWDVSTAVYDNKSFSTAGQDAATQDLSFKDDGTKMYIIGETADTVYQYSLSPAWDVSTAVYDSKSFSVNPPDTYPRGIYFKSDGLKMYAPCSTTYKIYQYSLSTPPSARWGAPAIYDSINQRMLIFGGQNNADATLEDVWELTLPASGAGVWTNRTPSTGGPTTGRWASTAIYDPVNTRMLIFGGYKYEATATYYNELWELEFSTPGTEAWTNRTPASNPAVRRGHTAIYQGDFAEKRMIIFGGYDGTTHYNDVWKLNITTPGSEAWAQITTLNASPVNRRSHTAVYDSVNQKMLMYGGRGIGTPVPFFNDTWELTLPESTTTWTWMQPPSQQDSYSESYYTTGSPVSAYTGHNQAVGQSFTNQSSAELTKAKFYLKKIGTPTGSAYAKLYAHSGTYGVDGVPTGSALATSDAFDVSTLTTSFQLITFNFTGANQYIMSPNTYYCIVFEYNSGGTSSNYVLVGTSSTKGHSGITCAYRTTLGYWSTLNYDTCFYVYSSAPIIVYLRAKVPVTSLTAGTSYHWQSWYTGSVTGDSTKLSYGGNSDTPPAGVDFSIQGAGINVSGNVYNYEGTTPLTECDADAGTYELSLKVPAVGTPYTASCSNVDGSFQFTGVTTPSTGAGMVIWINELGTDGALIVRYDGGGDSTGNIFWDNAVAVTSDDTTAATNTNMDTYDNGNDGDIPYTVTGTALTVNDGFELHITTAKTYTPGGTITTDPSSTPATTDGDLHIDGTGTLNMEANALSVGGDFNNEGTMTFTSNQTTTFTATATGHVITDGGENFENIIFNGASGGWSFADSTILNKDITMTAGTLSGTVDVTVNGGDVTGDGDIGITGGLFTADNTTGTSSFGGTTAWDFSSLTFSGSGGTTTATGTGAITIAETLTIGSSHILNAASKIWILSDATSCPCTPFVISGTFNADSSTFRYISTAATTVTRTTYNHLQLQPANTGSPTYTLEGGGTLTINGNLTISDETYAVTVNADTSDPVIDLIGDFTLNNTGIFTASATAGFSVGGSWTVGATATFTHSSATVVFDAAGTARTINSGGDPFYNVEFNNAAGGWSALTNTMTIANDLTMTAGTVDNSNGSADIVVNGNVAGTAGAFNLTAGTFEQRVTANKNFGATTGTTAWTFNNLTFSNSNGGGTGITITTQTGGSGNIIIGPSGVLNIGESGDVAGDTTTLSAGNRTWELQGTGGDPFQILASPLGVLTPAASTFLYNGDNGAGNTAVQSTTYNVLQVNNASETYALEGTTGGAAVTITAGVFDTGANALSATGDLTVTGTLQGTGNVTVNGNVTGAGIVTMTGGIFEQRVAADKNFGSSAGTNNWTFATLTFSNSNGTATPVTITPNAGTGGQIIISAGINIGKDGDASGATTTFNNETSNDRIFDINGNITISTKGAFSASSTAAFNLTGNFTDNKATSGGFTPNSGTVTIDGAGTSTFNGANTPAITFFNLTSTTAGKTLTFTAAKTFRIDGKLTITGASGNQITINSTDPTTPTQWKIDHQGTEDVTYASIRDSGCETGTTNVSLNTTSTDVSGNDYTCWLFPSLSFNINATSVSLGLNAGNSFTTTNTNTLTVTSRSEFGYNLTAYETDNLRHITYTSNIIDDWTGTNSSPTVFNETCLANPTKCGWGYNTNDSDLTQFIDSTYYAGFVKPASAPGDIVATSDSDIAGDVTTITYRASVDYTQAAGEYQTTIIYIVTPQF